MLDFEMLSLIQDGIIEELEKDLLSNKTEKVTGITQETQGGAKKAVASPANLNQP